MNKFAVIVLNWNGHTDTIECVDSLIKKDNSSFDIIIVDNGSENESVDNIQTWFSSQKLNLNEVASEDIPHQFGPPDLNVHEEDILPNYTLVRSEENLGFSAGNNLGIRYAMRFTYDSVIILNNDTAIEQSALSRLQDALDANPDWGACIPKIKYYDRKDTIWNAGGFLKPLGNRKYLYANQVDNPEYTGSQQVSFFTGCALMIRTSVISKYGGLCEDFFFGEEDYELAKRYSINAVKVFVVLDSVVYHKVGVSRAELLNKNALAYDFAQHLNRIIHMKRYMSKIRWQLWRAGSLLYIFYLMIIKKRVPLNNRFMKYLYELVRLSNKHSRVDRQLFLKSRELFE